MDNKIVIVEDSHKCIQKKSHVHHYLLQICYELKKKKFLAVAQICHEYTIFAVISALGA